MKIKEALEIINETEDLLRDVAAEFKDDVYPRCWVETEIDEDGIRVDYKDPYDNNTIWSIKIPIEHLETEDTIRKFIKTKVDERQKEELARKTKREQHEKEIRRLHFERLKKEFS